MAVEGNPRSNPRRSFFDPSDKLAVPDPQPLMNDLDSEIAALQNQLAHLERQREAARLERAKSYADAFIRKLEADGIPLKVGLQAFRDLSKFEGSKGIS